MDPTATSVIVIWAVETTTNVGNSLPSGPNWVIMALVPFLVSEKEVVPVGTAAIPVMAAAITPEEEVVPVMAAAITPEEVPVMAAAITPEKEVVPAMAAFSSAVEIWTTALVTCSPQMKGTLAHRATLRPTVLLSNVVRSSSPRSSG